MQPMALEETADQTPTTETQSPEAGSASEQPHAEQASGSADHSAEPAPAAAPRSEKELSMEDFATALETFEQEQAQTEAALNEEQVVTGTVLKVTQIGRASCR